MAGYTDRTVTFWYSHLSDDPDNDPLWITIRNPKLVPLHRLRPENITFGDDGRPAEETRAFHAVLATIARLVVDWRIYGTDIELDEAGHPRPQELLPLPATRDLVRNLPSIVLQPILAHIRETLAGSVTEPGSEYFEEVFAPAESIYDGTWSGAAPQEVVDFELMREMRWSWRDLQECPAYVKRFCWDFIQLRRQAEKDAIDRAREDAKRGNR